MSCVCLLFLLIVREKTLCFAHIYEETYCTASTWGGVLKILVAGNWHSELHEEPVSKAIEELGHRSVRFSWHIYFQPQGFWEKIFLPILKTQNKYMVGPIVGKLNCDLVAMVECEKPDVVFVYRGILIRRETLKRIKQVHPSTCLVGYNNDDPFSPLYPKWKWRHFVAGIPEYDLMLAYRLHNLEEYRNAGAKRVELMRSWFIPEMNHPVELTAKEKEQFECDVVFIGHYENDGRLAYLEEIVKQGWKLNFYGHGYGWHKHILKSDTLKDYYPLKTVWGKDYNKALCGAKIALCFFSKLNRDTYTRRCFEIPASGTLLLSEYSSDLAGLFREGVEADYFNNVEELVHKLSLYLRNDELLETVSQAGYEKVKQSGHDVKSRMKQLLKMLP